MSVYNQYTLVAVDQVLINWEGGDRRSSGVKSLGLLFICSPPVCHS